MSYTEKHFGRCVVNPAKKDLLKIHPELRQITTDERLMKYIICVYDPGSPFILQHKDIVIRKQLAAQYAGFDIVQQDGMLYNIYTLKDKDVRDSVMVFLKNYAFPREWMMIVANESTFVEYCERMMEPISKASAGGVDGGVVVKETDEMNAIEKKSRLSTHMQDLNERIEKGYRRMFGGDDSIDLPGSVGRTTAESMSGKVG